MCVFQLFPNNLILHLGLLEMYMRLISFSTLLDILSINKSYFFVKWQLKWEILLLRLSSFLPKSGLFFQCKYKLKMHNLLVKQTKLY